MFQVAELVAAQFVIQRLFHENSPATKPAGQRGVLDPAPARTRYVRERIVSASPQEVQIAGRRPGVVGSYVRQAVVVSRRRR